MTVTASAPELQEVKFSVLTIGTLTKSSKEVLGFCPESRTLRKAYAEVLAQLERRELQLDFACGKCRAPVDAQMPRCWACGADLDDGGDEPEPTDAVLRERAEKLGIRVEGVEVPHEDLIKLIDAELTRRRRASVSKVDLSVIESERVNTILLEELPKGWRTHRTLVYTTYFDPEGTRRFAVMHRGLAVHFSVADGDLDGVKNLEFLDEKERKCRHFGRSNYLFVGDVSKDALAVCREVIARYSK